MAKPTAIRFLASFPQIQSAIKRGADGMRITLDIPESELPNSVQLLALMGSLLRITVEIVPNTKNGKVVPIGDFEVTNRDD